MTKNMMESLVAYLNGETVTNIAEIKASLEAELAKNEAKAQANRDLYAASHDVVIGALTDNPVTLAELWETVKDTVPEKCPRARFSMLSANCGPPRSSRSKARSISTARRKPCQPRKGLFFYSKVRYI